MAAQFGTHRETGDANRRQAQYHAAFTGGLKGAGGGFAAAVPTAYVLNRSWAPFRGLTLPLKAFFVTMVTVASGVITADKAGLAFEVSDLLPAPRLNCEAEPAPHAALSVFALPFLSGPATQTQEQSTKDPRELTRSKSGTTSPLETRC